MKKTIISLSVFCLLLTTFQSRAAGNCYSSWGTATCQADDSQYSSDYFDFFTNSGLTLNFWAYLGGSGPDYQAYAYASWSSLGPTSYYYYDASSTYAPYYFDGAAQSGGGLNLNAYSQGAGSSAGVTASW